MSRFFVMDGENSHRTSERLLIHQSRDERRCFVVVPGFCETNGYLAECAVTVIGIIDFPCEFKRLVGNSLFRQMFQYFYVDVVPFRGSVQRTRNASSGWPAFARLVAISLKT